MKTLIKVVFFLLCPLFASLAQADIRYITDVAYVPMRSGAGNDYRILHYGLKSGLKLNVLEMPSGEWAKVQTPTGREGWVKKQHLVSTPIARTRLAKAQKDLLAVQQQLDGLKQEHNRLKEAHAALSESANQNISDKSELEKKYHELKKISDNAVNLDRQNKKLLAKNDMLQTELDSKIAIVASLSSDRTIEKWMVGAGLLFAGMILMLILPMLKPKKRYSEWA